MLYLFIVAGLAAGSGLAQEAAGDVKARARGVRDYARGGSENIAKIRPYLRDPELEVRIEAVKALVEIGTQYSLEPLVEATRDNDPEVQIRAADGLVNFYLPGYVKTGMTASLRRAGGALRAKFSVKSEDRVIDAWITPRPEIVESLGKLARGGASMESRANAARALGILRGRAAVADLVAALRSKNDEVIFESLAAIRKIGDPAAGPGLAFLLRDLQERVQLSAIETTGLLRNQEAIPALRDVLETSANVKVRRAALFAIAMMPTPEVRPLFDRFFTDGDDELRAAAAEGIGRLRNPADLTRVWEAWERESKSYPRLALAFAAALLGRHEAGDFTPLTHLVNTLNSRSLRSVAEAYLVEVARDAGARRQLLPAVAEGTKDQRLALARVLAQSGAGDSVAALEALQNDRDPEVASEGVRSLRALRARLR